MAQYFITPPSWVHSAKRANICTSNNIIHKSRLPLYNLHLNGPKRHPADHWTGSNYGPDRPTDWPSPEPRIINKGFKNGQSTYAVLYGMTSSARSRTDEACHVISCFITTRAHLHIKRLPSLRFWFRSWFRFRPRHAVSASDSSIVFPLQASPLIHLRQPARHGGSRLGKLSLFRCFNAPSTIHQLTLSSLDKSQNK